MEPAVDASTAVDYQPPVYKYEDLHGTWLENAQKATLKNRSADVWAFFFCVEDIDLMVCSICHPNSVDASKIELIESGRLKKNEKGLMMYKRNNGTNNMSSHMKKKHGDALEEYRTVAGKQEVKKRLRSTSLQQKVTESFAKKSKVDSAKKFVPGQRGPQQAFERNLALMATKDLRPPNMLCDSAFFRKLILTHEPKLSFPSRLRLREKLIPQLRKEVDDGKVVPALTQSGNVIACGITFDLWMSRQTEDIFAVVVHFIDMEWEVKAYCLGMLKMSKTDGAALNDGFHPVVTKYGLEDKILAFVSDEGANLDTCVNSFNESIRNSAAVAVAIEPFHGPCAPHLISKGISRVFVKKNQGGGDPIDTGLQHVDIQAVKKKLQSNVTYTKKSGKGMSLWKEAQVKSNIHPTTLLTPVKTRFGSALAGWMQACEKQPALNLLFSELVANKYKKRCLNEQDWIIIRYTCAVLTPVKKCIGKQQTRYSKYWLLSDAVESMCRLYVAFTGDEWSNGAASLLDDHLDHQEDAELIAELEQLGSAIAAAMLQSISPFTSPFHHFEHKRAHLVMALMLDPRFCKLELLKKIATTRASAQALTNDYDTNALIPLVANLMMREQARELVHAPPSSHLSDSEATDAEAVSSDSGLFGSDDGHDHSIISAHKTEAQFKAIVQKELSSFRKMKLPAATKTKLAAESTSYGPLDWWKENQKDLPGLALVARAVLGIPGAQIECERLFSAAGIITRHRRSRTSAETVDNVMFVNYNLSDEDALGLNEESSDDDAAENELDSIIDELEMEMEVV